MTRRMIRRSVNPDNQPADMTRLKAFRVHLLASACVGAVVATLVFFLWYPDFYFKASGAQILIATLIFVDVVIGPALTLLLFKPGKWGLAFDMSVIVLLQVGALVYGLSVIIGSRPVFLVAAVDRFVVVSANQVEPGELVDPNHRLAVLDDALVPTTDDMGKLDPHDLLLAQALGQLSG